MIVKIDSLGRILIPKKYREEFNLKSNSEANMLPLPDGSGDRTLVPLRAVSEAFDAVVDWDEATSTVTITL